MKVHPNCLCSNCSNSSNSLNCLNSRGGALFVFLLLLAGFFAMTIVLWMNWERAKSPRLGGARAEIRQQYLEEVRAESEAMLSQYGVVNAEKGIYRIPIERAMETMIREWKQPEVALKRMAERVDLATALPPPPPEVPSEFE